MTTRSSAERGSLFAVSLELAECLAMIGDRRAAAREFERTRALAVDEIDTERALELTVEAAASATARCCSQRDASR